MQKEFEEMMTENPNIKRQNTPIRKDTVVKRRKMSYGAVVRNDDEEEEIDDDSDFDGMPESNASKFIREYEKMVANYTDQAKVDTFPRYLTGAAANWLEIAERDLKSQFCFNDCGVQSNGWLELKWPQLRRLFEKEFVPDRVNQFITTRQSSNETGATFFYRITNLHAQSGMLLDEDSLMTLIVDHMQPHYQEYFRYKKFASLKALKDALVMFDRRRRDILLTREAEVGGKRKSTLAAILDMDSEDVNLRLARHLPAIQEESEPTTEPMKKMLQKMEQIEGRSIACKVIQNDNDKHNHEIKITNSQGGHNNTDRKIARPLNVIIVTDSDIIGGNATARAGVRTCQESRSNHNKATTAMIGGINKTQGEEIEGDPLLIIKQEELFQAPLQS
ncbi:hypothetical protein Fcan01_24009 [Folsomia candida]|uniref:Uncharacterized protein n=1 Tax=Folsomia candida TaxID=158441 RepID=A0A226D6U4_FOLCA|nr:hypothetical protein Fcan01_24009 [Folsomia candida]